MTRGEALFSFLRGSAHKEHSEKRTKILNRGGKTGEGGGWWSPEKYEGFIPPTKKRRIVTGKPLKTKRRVVHFTTSNLWGVGRQSLPDKG